MNYEKLDRKDSFTFAEVAMFWCGYDDPSLFSRTGTQYVHALIILKKLQEDVEKGVLSVEKMPTKEDVWEDAVVSREQLTAWAESKGDRPKFLFPAERIDFDYSKWDKQESFSLIEAAKLWYDIDLEQGKVDRTSLQYLKSVMLFSKFQQMADQGVICKLPVLKENTTNDWTSAIVSREVLKAVAVLSSDKPAFLFPEKRTSKNNLSNLVYENILQDIHNMGKDFERRPSVYAGKSEPHLRDHLLTVLQGRFNCSATGESFNESGKTDILLTRGSEIIFVAECKFWKGKKSYLDAITQLMRYLTWRDSKTAVIIFVRNKDISSVLKMIEQVTPTHPCYSSNVGQKEEGWDNYIFHLEGDKECNIKMAVMVYHLLRKTT
jgi:hypothetical protein